MLEASAWESNTIVISGLARVDNDARGYIGLANSATAEQRAIARDAILFPTEIKNGSVTIVADGEVPTVDIPVTIILTR